MAGSRGGRLVRGLLAGCHPGPTAAVTALAVLLGVGVGVAAPAVVVLGAAVLSGQLAIGWTNDALDAGRDRASGRTDKPAARGDISTAALRRAAGVAVVLSAGCSLLLGLPAAVAALLLVAAGLAYDLGLKATPWSAAAYVVGFGALPAAPYLALPGHPWPPWWAPVTGALLGVAAHVGNVLPDLAADAATGVRGLPHRLGPAVSRGLLAACCAGAGVVAVVGSGAIGASGSTPSPWAVVGLVLVVVGSVTAWVAGARRPDSVISFAAVVAVAFVDVVVFVLAV